MDPEKRINNSMSSSLKLRFKLNEPEVFYALYCVQVKILKLLLGMEPSGLRSLPIHNEEFPNLDDCCTFKFRV